MSQEDPILRWVDASVDGLAELSHYDRLGRVMLTFMYSHMAEVTGPLNVSSLRYFQDCYGPVAQEFFQAAETDFMIHHCSRTLFWVWQEQVERLQLGPLGKALESRGVGLPMPTLPTRGDRSVIVPYGYEAVRDALHEGNPPPAPQPLNPVLAPDRCEMYGRTDLIFGELEKQVGDAWGRQVLAMWRIVGETMALRAQVENGLSEELAVLVVENGSTYAEALDRLKRSYTEWHRYHEDSVDIHDDLFGKFSQGMFEFVGEKFPEWTIAPPLQHEMYVEVTLGAASLLGRSLNVPDPDFRYWRRVPWSPACISVGAPGMPPFEPAALSA